MPRGSQFPAERDLSKKLGVSFSSVHRAVVELEKELFIIKKSPRIRIIAEDSVSAAVKSDSLKNTIIFVSPKYREDLPMYFKRPGWGYYNYIALLVAIQNKGFSAMMMTPEIFNSEIDMHLRNRPFGVVFSENSGLPPPPETCSKLFNAGIPFVAYGDFPGIDRVTCDHSSGTYELAKYLISRGSRRIALYIQEDHRNGYWIKDRLDGLKKATSEEGLDYLEPIYELPLKGVTGRNEEEYFKARAAFSAGCLAPALLGSNPPDTLMLLSDWIVPQISTACEVLGKKPGTDILIAGYDNFYDETPDFRLNPALPVATVEKFLAESGRKMAEILFARAEGKLPPEPKRIMITPKVIPIEVKSSP